jgi:hypothetical protein
MTTALAQILHNTRAEQCGKDRVKVHHRCQSSEVAFVRYGGHETGMESKEGVGVFLALTTSKAPGRLANANRFKGRVP